MQYDEEWRPCPSFPEFEASSLGRVRNSETKRVRQITMDRSRYALVGFRREGKIVARSLHVLVADAFLGPRPLRHEVRHLDGDRTNNAPSNLEYGTARENARDRLIHGRNPHGERNGMAKLPEAGVRVIRAAYAAGAANQYELADLFGISQAQVNNIVLNKQRQRAA